MKSNVTGLKLQKKLETLTGIFLDPEFVVVFETSYILGASIFEGVVILDLRTLLGVSVIIFLVPYLIHKALSKEYLLKEVVILSLPGFFLASFLNNILSPFLLRNIVNYWASSPSPLIKDALLMIVPGILFFFTYRLYTKRLQKIEFIMKIRAILLGATISSLIVGVVTFLRFYIEYIWSWSPESQVLTLEGALIIVQSILLAGIFSFIERLISLSPRNAEGKSKDQLT